MPTQAQLEREQLQLRSVKQWETERQTRADAFAAVLTHLNAAVVALPMCDLSAPKMARELSFSIGSARGRLRAVLNETNPFVA